MFKRLATVSFFTIIDNLLVRSSTDVFLGRKNWSSIQEQTWLVSIMTINCCGIWTQTWNHTIVRYCPSSTMPKNNWLCGFVHKRVNSVFHNKEVIYALWAILPRYKCSTNAMCGNFLSVVTMPGSFFTIVENLLVRSSTDVIWGRKNWSSIQERTWLVSIMKINCCGIWTRTWNYTIERSPAPQCRKIIDFVDSVAQTFLSHFFDLKTIYFL